MSSQTRAEDRFDLSRWRIAGNGADMIRPDVMQAFVDSFADAGFKAQRLLPQLRSRRSDARGLADAAGRRHPARAGRGERAVGRRHAGAENVRAAIARSSIAASRSNGMEIEIRGADGELLPDRGIGKVFVRGTSVMHSYFRDEESTDACLSDDGWLDTGDMGYMSGGYIFIVGRAKDMIIINGRNHWPQDIEWAVEQLPGFKSGDIAAFAITGPIGRGNAGRARPLPRVATLRSAAGCATTSANASARSPASRRSSSSSRRARLPRTSSGKLSRTKARNLYLSRRNPALRHRRLSVSDSWEPTAARPVKFLFTPCVYDCRAEWGAAYVE